MFIREPKNNFLDWKKTKVKFNGGIISQMICCYL